MLTHCSNLDVPRYQLAAETAQCLFVSPAAAQLLGVLSAHYACSLAKSRMLVMAHITMQ
jgi:hypothetical protein